ncbi:hypothetical protein [Catelliglobosispora koreensis]|uniref:hypothetical protein n=1 Tax=Catelliglobosispora koreensis TaxID=129052 RepID=UPI000367476B|nr:hypothetical protein [Catelliglobosispora koreensis]
MAIESGKPGAETVFWTLAITPVFVRRAGRQSEVRVSEYYELGRSQAELDFVDVDIRNDVGLFLDPKALAQISSPWADSCVASVQSFFQRVLDAIAVDDHPLAIQLLSMLREPNETHLGLSRGQSRGSGLGHDLAEDFWAALSTSGAVRTGLIQDLEDTALVVEGIDRDRISDITTNLIRRELIEYTQETCDYYGITLVPGVSSGPLWHAVAGEWREEFTSLPMPDGEKLILIPKAIVRRGLHMNASEFYRHHVLNYLVDQEPGSSLGVLLRRSARITKKSVDAKYKDRFDAGRHNPGVEKRINAFASQGNPELLQSYREVKSSEPSIAIPDEELVDAIGGPVVTLNDLLRIVLATPLGNDAADEYERRVEALTSALFYPHLVFPRRQQRIHDGRKRIDISYTNNAIRGFFHFLALNYPAAHVVLECKNYSRPIANPELDQLQGRFSPSRGKFGLLVYRGFVNKASIWQSCVDTARDDRGFIIPIDDEDLQLLVEEQTLPASADHFGFLHQQFQRLIGMIP